MEEKQRLTDPDAEQEQTPIDRVSLPVLHLYRTQGGLLFLPDEAVREQEEGAAIESVPFDLDRQHLGDEDTPPLREPQGQPAPKVGRLTVALVLLVNMTILLSAIIATLLQTVTIVIVPKSTTITTRVTLANVQSTVFSPLTLTQTKTVPATGHGYQPAIQAQGTITFYNALTQPQTVYAGTLLVDSHGLQVVTSEDATIPSATPPIEGHITVAAHAVLTGSAGNIPEGDINGPCCRSNITVSNTSFSGGEDSRNFTIVTKQDIQNVSSTLLPTLTQAINISFDKQVRPNETLIQPLCSQTINADHQIGKEAQSVTITVKKSCIAAAYTTADLQTKMVHILSQKEPGYRLKAYFQLDSFQASLHQNRLSVSSTYQATYRYQFTQAETNKVLTEVKGKQTRQAEQLLGQLPGVEHITITTPTNQDTLPIDVTYIHLLIIEG